MVYNDQSVAGMRRRLRESLNFKKTELPQKKKFEDVTEEPMSDVDDIWNLDEFSESEEEEKDEQQPKEEDDVWDLLDNFSDDEPENECKIDTKTPLKMCDEPKIEISSKREEV